MGSFALIIFGITSNLAQIKLIPALYDMAESGVLPEDFQIIGTARSPMSHAEYLKYWGDVLHQENRHHAHQIDESVVKKLLTRVHYINGQLDDPLFYDRLGQYLDELDGQNESSRTRLLLRNRIFYLATYPDLYHHIFENLHRSGLSQEKSGFVRLMIEKPIGKDETSARQLNKLLLKYFQESQIFRLDHYLGKETLQNILTFRFGNGIFEPMMNKDYIDHVQITAAEDFGVGKRGGYYDAVGALKDVGQNHQLQMIALSLMEAPSEFSNEAVTRERIKILEHLRPEPSKVVFGQYEGYTKEANVDANSLTDTFYAFRTEIDLPRYKGVPIYVRAGKKLAQTVTEIAVVFKTPTNRLLRHLDCGNEPNVLIYRIQPNEGIVLKVLVKKPGQKLELVPEFMQYCYKDPLPSRSGDSIALARGTLPLASAKRHGDGVHYLPDPYERLLLDAMTGDQTFFNDSAEVEAEWRFTDPLSDARRKLNLYKPGSWGPKEADKLLGMDGRCWLVPSMDFCRI